MLRILYHRLLTLSASRRAPLWLALVAFAESSFFPLPPDALLIPMVLARPHRAWALALICTAGSVLGGCLGYYIGAELFDAVAMPLLRFYHYQDRFLEAKNCASAYWLRAMLIKGLLPIPYKIVTIASGVIHYSFPKFVLASVATRGARFFLEAGLLRFYGERARDFIERRLGLVLLGFAMLLVGGMLALTYLSPKTAGGGCIAASPR